MTNLNSIDLYYHIHFIMTIAASPVAVRSFHQEFTSLFFEPSKTLRFTVILVASVSIRKMYILPMVVPSTQIRPLGGCKDTTMRVLIMMVGQPQCLLLSSDVFKECLQFFRRQPCSLQFQHLITIFFLDSNYITLLTVLLVYSLFACIFFGCYLRTLACPTTSQSKEVANVTVSDFGRAKRKARCVFSSLIPSTNVLYCQTHNNIFRCNQIRETYHASHIYLKFLKALACILLPAFSLQFFSNPIVTYFQILFHLFLSYSYFSSISSWLFIIFSFIFCKPIGICIIICTNVTIHGFQYNFVEQKRSLFG